uniref:Uncharacterized protein n=1 Tax=Pyxicephalus adspersus TaxID=30357 RepID=A0AAV3AZT5_PYXAD|nr:TPA: hypothetical protein GDO54_002092 [Pyxicephalus adspersus]
MVHTQEWLIFLRYSHLQNKQTLVDKFKFRVSNTKMGVKTQFTNLKHMAGSWMGKINICLHNQVFSKEVLYIYSGFCFFKSLQITEHRR